MHCTYVYTGRLLMQDMLYRRCAGVDGDTYSIQKHARPFQFWRRSSVRNSLFCSPMVLWPLSWMSVSKCSDRELDFCFPIRIPSFWLIVLPSEFMFLKILLLPVFFVSLNWDRTSRPNKASSRWLFARYLSALIEKFNLTFDDVANGSRKHEYSFNIPFPTDFNPLKPELNPICYLLALLGAHHFLHVSRISVKLSTFRRLMSYIYGAPILDVSRSHTTTQHSR